MRHLCIAIASATLSILLASCAPSADPNFGIGSAETPTETIALTRVFPQPGQLALFVSDADGSNERPLIEASVADYDGVWAPDGSTIVFTSERAGSADLYRIREDGSELERLTDDPAYDDQAAFSPDGNQLVYVTTRADGTSDLWILDLNSSQARPLTSGPGGDFRPTWSPDGEWIAFSSDRLSDLPFAYGRWEHLQLVDLYLIRPDGSDLRQLTEHGEFCGSPRWTGDGLQVVAYCMTAQQTMDGRRAVPERDEDTRIVAIDIDGGNVTELDVGPGVNFNPSLLGNDLIAYIRRDTDDAGVFYSNGTRGPSGPVRMADWSPDGARVVYHKRMSIERQPWVETYSKDSQYQLFLTSALPAFSPAGDRYVFMGRGGLNGEHAGTGAAWRKRHDGKYRWHRRPNGVSGPDTQHSRTAVDSGWATGRLRHRYLRCIFQWFSRGVSGARRPGRGRCPDCDSQC
jgi:TolB protein